MCSTKVRERSTDIQNDEYRSNQHNVPFFLVKDMRNEKGGGFSPWSKSNTDKLSLLVKQLLFYFSHSRRLIYPFLFVGSLPTALKEEKIVEFEKFQVLEKRSIWKMRYLLVAKFDSYQLAVTFVSCFQKHLTSRDCHKYIYASWNFHQMTSALAVFKIFLGLFANQVLQVMYIINNHQPQTRKFSKCSVTEAN